MKDDDDKKRLDELEKQIKPEYLEKAAEMMGKPKPKSKKKKPGSSRKSRSRSKKSSRKRKRPTKKRKPTGPSGKEKIKNIMDNINKIKSSVNNIINDIKSKDLDNQEVINKLLNINKMLDNIDTGIKNKKVFIIIPDKKFRRQIYTSLKSHGFKNMEQFESGKKALKKLIQVTSQKKVDYILSDINLGDFNIVKLSKNIKLDNKLNKACPFMKLSNIVVVSKNMSKGLEKLKKQDLIKGYLRWPFNINDLVEKLKKY